MKTSLDFSGFPEEALSFLAGLAANNNRTWFEAHKQEYRDFIVGPTQQFVIALGERLAEISDQIVYDTRTNGAGSMMRIYRDTRFSKDKTPYKTNIAVAFWEGSNKKMRNPIFGFQFGPEGGGLMAGMHAFQPEQLAAYRTAVADPKLGRELTEALDEVRRAGDYVVGGEHYKRVPRGFDPEHPRADLLRFNALYVYSPAIPPEVVTGPEIVDVCFAHCQAMAPVHRWLVRAMAGGTR